MEEHKEHFREVLSILQQHQQYAQPIKCYFLKDKVTFVGHVVGKGQLRMDPKKVSPVRVLERPTGCRTTSFISKLNKLHLKHF